MTLTLYTNTSENNKLTKTLTTLNTLTGNLKIGTSIIKPVIQVSDITIANIKACNYCYISDFGRYYFVTDIKSVNNNLWEITARVDVLSTYATQIRAQTAVIKRQENSWNLYLDDPLFKAYQNPNIVVKNFPNGFSTQNFVLAVAGS